MSAHPNPETCTRGFGGTRCPACRSTIDVADPTVTWSMRTGTDEIWRRVDDGPWERVTQARGHVTTAEVKIMVGITLAFAAAAVGAVVDVLTRRWPTGGRTETKETE